MIKLPVSDLNENINFMPRVKKLYYLTILFAAITSCSTDTVEELKEPIGNTPPPTLQSTSDWMGTLINAYTEKNIALNDITITRSHDAGTYVLDSCTFGANSCNTQTQHLNMTDQLEIGLRVFDIRPVLTWAIERKSYNSA